MLVQWQPVRSLGRQHRRQYPVFRGFGDVHREMNRFFDEFWGTRQPADEQRVWLPAIDVSENDAEYQVKAELPGMAQDDIEVHLENNVLTLKGEKKHEAKEEKENYLRVERSYGSFSRSFELPSGVKQEEIEANFKDGILEVTLPKSEEHKAKRIAIAAGS